MFPGTKAVSVGFKTRNCGVETVLHFGEQRISSNCDIYLRHGSYVFIGVCLFVCLSVVSRITQKLLNRCSQNSMERRHMSQEPRKNQLDFGGNPDPGP